MRSQHKKMTNEDKFARKYYCNSYRFTNKIKKYNNKKFRRDTKAATKSFVATVREVNSRV